MPSSQIVESASCLSRRCSPGSQSQLSVRNPTQGCSTHSIGGPRGAAPQVPGKATQALAPSDGRNTQPSVNPARQKYSTLPKFGNDVCVVATRPKKEGRIAIVTNAGRAAVGVGHVGAKGFAGRATVSEGLAHTTGVIGVRQNRVVLAPGVCAPSLVVMRRFNRTRTSVIGKATGAIVQRSPGRARHKP